ncbi:hypothetical protein BDK51DRAFT_43618, partial [Blyttiomyces helicus]
MDGNAAPMLLAPSTFEHPSSLYARERSLPFTRALAALSSAAPATPTSDPVAHIHACALAALSSPSPPAALPHAEALLDLATEQLHAVPYNRVTLQAREAYETAALLKALALAAPDPTLADEDRETARRNALKTLDMALLMSACPCHRELVMDLVVALQSPSAASPAPTPPPPHPRPRLTHPVSIAFPAPSLLSFSGHLSTRNPTPILIRSALTHWPALSTRPWSDLEYLRATAGASRTVPVELGARYTDSGWTQTLMP